MAMYHAPYHQIVVQSPYGFEEVSIETNDFGCPVLVEDVEASKTRASLMGWKVLYLVRVTMR